MQGLSGNISLQFLTVNYMLICSSLLLQTVQLTSFDCKITFDILVGSFTVFHCIQYRNLLLPCKLFSFLSIFTIF